MKHRDERPRIDREDRDFADQLAAHYAPPPWTSAKRVGFDEAHAPCDFCFVGHRWCRLSAIGCQLDLRWV